MFEKMLICLAHPLCIHTDDPGRIYITWQKSELPGGCPGLLLQCSICGAKEVVGSEMLAISVIAVINKKVKAKTREDDDISEGDYRETPSNADKPDCALNTPPRTITHSREITPYDVSLLRSMGIKPD